MYRGLSPAHQNHQIKGIEAKLVAKRHPVPDLWRDSKNNGALLIVAPKERKVRIEVGYGLEGELTDAICRTIIDNYILPSFKRGDYNAGVLAGTTSMLQVLGGNPPEMGQPANSFGEGHFTPAVAVKVKPPSVPQIVAAILWATVFTLLIFFILPRSLTQNPKSEPRTS